MKKNNHTDCTPYRVKIMEEQKETFETLKEYVCDCLCKYPMECLGQCRTTDDAQEMLIRRFCKNCRMDMICESIGGNNGTNV